jgi:hypothetical protein
MHMLDPSTKPSEREMAAWVRNREQTMSKGAVQKLEYDRHRPQGPRFVDGYDRWAEEGLQFCEYLHSDKPPIGSSFKFLHAGVSFIWRLDVVDYETPV